MTLNAPGQLDRLSGKVRLTGTIACSVSAVVSMNAVLRQRLTRAALASGGAGTYGPCSPTPAAWTLDLIPQGNAPFGNGWAQLDLSASGYDPYYATFVTVSTSDAIKLQR